ncbi:hypothetical protein UXP65_15695 [Enterobacter kobei]|uniref:hypothetical protein n=1 Tax=Enterobacter kobei TaxID=208224 RepID=UPI002FD14EBD
MSTITREQLHERAREKVKSLEFAVTQTAFADSRAELEEELELARIALASLEAEAVCVIDQSNLDYLKSGSDADVWPASRAEMGDVLLYRSATPAPASVPAAMEMDDDFDSAFEHGKAVGWNAYRAAMLQGAEPVTTAYKLPANTPCKDAPEHIWLQTAGVWPENGEFSELTWCSDNQHPDDTLYVRADVVTGNSPVVPDGWVMVPVEPTHEMLEAGDEQFGTYDVYRRMIAAAPKQEVK